MKSGIAAVEEKMDVHPKMITDVSADIDVAKFLESLKQKKQMEDEIRQF